VAPADGFDFDDRVDRVDRDALWRFLSTEAYWGRWRDRAVVEEQVARAWRVVGCYERATGAMVGFARAASDGYSFAYLADVYVEAAYRGRGLGAALVAAMIDEGPGAAFTWVLHTTDAHGLYEKFGFAAPGPRVLERPSRFPAAPGTAAAS
jgi:GNAT superfamily N-acetyltransferase